MASDKETPGGTASSSKTGASGSAGPSVGAAGSGKRPVTIDLEAKRVGNKPEAEATAKTTAAAPKAPTGDKKEAPKATSATSSASSASTATSSSSSASSSDKASASKSAATDAANKAKTTGAASPSQASASTTSATTGSASKSAETPKSSGSKTFSEPPASAPKSGIGFGGVLAAALFGGVVVLAGGYGLYSSGVLKLGGASSQELNMALSRISELESTQSNQASSGRIADLEDKVAALSTGGDKGGFSDVALARIQKQIDTLSSRLESLGTGNGGDVSSEQLGDVTSALNNLKTELQNVAKTAETAQSVASSSDVSLKTLADSQSELSKTLSTVTTDLQSIKTQLSSDSDRLAALEKSLGDASAREMAARAVSVSALKSAVDAGRPFKTELAAVRAGLETEPENFAQLETFAETGVTPTPVLVANFPAVARRMFATFDQPAQGDTVIDSFLASAKSLVSVRGPGDGEGGHSPEAVLRRMETAVSKGDLASAEAAYGELPEPAKKAGEDWIGEVRARLAVDALAQQASDDVLQALSRKESRTFSVGFDRPHGDFGPVIRIAGRETTEWSVS